MEIKEKQGHIPSLDGIRALSFLLVFVAHAGLSQYVPGGMGVTIFFFLSGFLITTLMRQEYEKSRTLNLKYFYGRRALRILPPLYLVLLVAALASPSVEWRPVTAQVLQATNYWAIYRGGEGIPVGTGVYWSLSVEEHFYLLFPWIFIALQRWRPRRQALLMYGLCAAILAWRCWLVLGMHVSTDRTYMGTDTRIDSILFGCALAVWNSPVADRVERIEWRWKWLYVPAALIVLAGCLAVRNDAFRETVRYSLQGMALTILFIAAIRFPLWLPMRLLNARPMVFIGLLSYSLYLLHFAVIFAIQRLCPALGPVEQGVVALAASVACSGLIYVSIEKKCAELRRRLK